MPSPMSRNAHASGGRAKFLGIEFYRAFAAVVALLGAEACAAVAVCTIGIVFK